MKLDRTVAEVAALVGGSVEGDGERRLAELESPARAGPQDLAPFFGTPSAASLQECRAGALLLGTRATYPGPSAAPGAGAAPAAPSLIRVDDADRAVDRLVLALVPEERAAPGVHPTAVIGPEVELGADVSIGPHVVLGRGARVGARTVLRAGVCLGEQARVGADGVLHEHVVIGSRCLVGDRVVIFAGAVIGSDGFGFRQDRAGRHERIPQRGIVIVGDDVEIGANCGIDRARFTATRIGNGSKLDNLIQVGHNVELGEHCALAALTGIAGSTILGSNVMVGGHAAIANGLNIGARTIIFGNTGIMRDLEPGSRVAGSPCQPYKAWARDVLHVQRLGELFARVKAIEDGRSGAEGAHAP